MSARPVPQGINCRGFHADTMHMARLWNSSRTMGKGYSLEVGAPSPPLPWSLLVQRCNSAIAAHLAALQSSLLHHLPPSTLPSPVPSAFPA